MSCIRTRDALRYHVVDLVRGRVAKGWDASVTPNGTSVLVHLANQLSGRFDVTIRGRNPNPGRRAMSVLACTQHMLLLGDCSWRGLHLVWRSVTCQTCSPSWDLRRVVPGDRAPVLKAAVQFTASKVGQDLGPRRLSASTIASVAPIVIAKKRAEIAKARPEENTGHRGCHAFVVLRGWV